MCYNNKMAINKQDWRDSSNRHNKSIYLIFRSFLFHLTLPLRVSFISLNAAFLVLIVFLDVLWYILKLMLTFIHVHKECHTFCVVHFCVTCFFSHFCATWFVFCSLLCHMFCSCLLLCHMFFSLFTSASMFRFTIINLSLIYR